MIERTHPKLSVAAQCQLLSISRSSCHYAPHDETALKLDRLKRAKTKISMDGKARYLDNIFIERLWRSLKYECVYLHAWETGSQAKADVGRWITFYNHQRPHAAHGRQPPTGVYFQTDQQVQAVA